MKKLVYEMARYGVVGVSSSAADFLSYLALTRLVGFTPQFANVLAYLVGHVLSFVGNRAWTFRSSGKLAREYSRFWMVNLIGLAVSQTVIWTGLELGVHDLIAKTAAIIISGFCNFTLNRFWTFRKRGKIVV